VSALANYWPDGCSMERLMTLLTALGNVAIVISNKPRSRPVAQILLAAD
jgi:hypothetical protein